MARAETLLSVCSGITLFLRVYYVKWALYFHNIHCITRLPSRFSLIGVILQAAVRLLLVNNNACCENLAKWHIRAIGVRRWTWCIYYCGLYVFTAATWYWLTTILKRIGFFCDLALISPQLSCVGMIRKRFCSASSQLFSKIFCSINNINAIVAYQKGLYRAL